MSDAPVERIYAEVGIKSTLTSDLAGVAEGFSSAEGMVNSFSTSVTAAGTLVSTTWDTALYSISSFAETSRVNFEKVKESLVGLSSQVKRSSQEFTISIKEMTLAAASFRGVQDLTKGFASGEQETIARFKQVANLMKIDLPEGAKNAKGALEELGTVTARTRNVMDLFASTIAAVPAIIVAKFEGLGVKVAAEFEVVSLQLERFYGDLETATDRFQKFSAIAAKTPFQFDEIMRSVLMMKDIGIQADNYINTLMDTSSAMNRTLDESTRTFVAAIGGRFQMLRNYGIYAYQVTQTNMDQISKMAGKEVEVGQTALLYYDMQGQQKVATVSKYNKEMIASTLEAIWNEKFSGAMEKFSQTFTGLWSTVQDTFKYAVAEIVGYSMEDMQTRTVSLMSVLKLLERGLISVFNAWASLPGPIQTFASVILTSVGVLSAFVAAMGILGFILPSVGAGLKAVNTLLLGTTVAAEGATVAVAGLDAVLAFAGSLVGITELVLVVAAAVAVLDLLQEKFGILNPAIEAFNNVMTITAYGVTVVTQDLQKGISEGLDPYIKKFEELDKQVDTFLEKHPLIKKAIDVVVEGFKIVTGIKTFEVLNDGIKGVAENTRDRATEIKAITEGMEKYEEEHGKTAKKVNKDIIESNNELGENYAETSDGIMGNLDDVAEYSEDSSLRMQKAYKDAADKYKEELSIMNTLSASGLKREDPNFDKDYKKLTSIEEDLPDVEDDIQKAQDKLTDLNKKLDKTQKDNVRALGKLQEDINEQIKEVEKLTNAGIDNNPEVIKMEKDLTKEKKKLQDLYTDDSVQEAKEKLAELYSTESIDKEKRQLEKLYSDNSIQKAKEKLAEIMSTEAIDDAKEKLQELYEDDSVEEAKEKLAELYSDDSIAKEEAKLEKLYSTKDIEEAKEKLAELYSTDDIDKEVKKLQKLYADDSIEEAKEKLQELYSTEDIDKEKQKLLDLFNDESVQEAKDKLLELQSDTSDIDSEKAKLLDLQNDLLNNQEYALASKQTIEEEIAALETLYSKLSGETTQQSFEDITDPLIREMMESRIGGEGSDQSSMKDQVQEKLKELRLELAKLNPDSNAYTSELVAQLEQYTKEAEEIKQKAETDPTADNIQAYMELQEKILDLQKEIAESKNNPNVDPVTELQNQIKEQQQRIAEMEEQRTKEIQEQQERVIELERQRAEDIKNQQEKIVQLEKERIEDIKDQQEKIAQMEIDRAEDIKEQEERIAQMKEDREKSIREQQEKIIELQKQHDESIAEQEKKIAEMKADREKDIKDQQEKIAKLEEQRAKDIKDQQEKIAKLESDRVKDIKDQQEKIAQLEKDHAEAVIEQQKKISKMEEERVKDIKEQQKKIAKLEEDLAQEKIDTQDRITEIENNILEKKQELNEALIKAQKKLDEAKQTYQDTILDQSANVADLQGQITEQNSLILKLQSKLEKLESDRKIYESKVLGEFGTEGNLYDKIAEGGVIGLNPQAGLPAGSGYYLQRDAKTGELALHYMTEEGEQVKLLSELHLKDGQILDGINGKYMYIDESINHNFDSLQRMYDYANANGAVLLWNNEALGLQFEENRKRLEANTRAAKEWTDIGVSGFEPYINKQGEAVIGAQTLNDLLTGIDSISMADAEIELVNLLNAGKITSDEYMTMRAYVAQLNNEPLRDQHGNILKISDYLTVAGANAVITKENLHGINQIKLLNAVQEVQGVSTGLYDIGTGVENGKFKMDSFNKDADLSNVTNEVGSVNTSLKDTTDETGLTKAGFLDIDALSVPNIRKWIQTLTENTKEGNKQDSIWNDSITYKDTLKFDRIKGHSVGLKDSAKEGSKEDNAWNLSITKKDGLRLDNIRGRTKDLTGDEKAGTKQTDDWNISFGKTNSTKLTNVQGEVTTTGKNVDTSKGKTDLLNIAMSAINDIKFPTLTSVLDTLGKNIDTISGKISGLLTTAGTTATGIYNSLTTAANNAATYIEKKYNEYTKSSSSSSSSTPKKSSNASQSVNSVKQSNNNNTVNNVKIGTQNNNGATLQMQNMQKVYWWL